MKNKEKYKELLEDYALAGVSWGKTDGEIKPCGELRCDECDFNDIFKTSCALKRLAWLNLERIERECVKSKIDTTPVAIESKWIPCSVELPKDLVTVNVTWINRKPVRRYAHIKDKPFTATGMLYNGKWFWWSKYTEDLLSRHGEDKDDEVDKDIEITAWMPTPEPYGSDINE